VGYCAFAAKPSPKRLTQGPYLQIESNAYGPHILRQDSRDSAPGTFLAGRFGRILQAQGFQLDIKAPRFGEPLPATLKDYDGAIVFGGPMSANDEHACCAGDGLDRGCAQGGEAVLGICLGRRCWRAISGTGSARIRKGALRSVLPDPSN